MTLSESRRTPLYAILICCVLSVVFLSPLLPPKLETLFWSRAWMKLSLAFAALAFCYSIGVSLAMSLGTHPAMAIHHKGQFLAPWIVMAATSLVFASIYLWAVGFISPVSLFFATITGGAASAWLIFPLFKRL